MCMDKVTCVCFLLASVFLFGSFQSHLNECDNILNIDCITSYQAHGDETTCGTDGQTYINKCFFVQARCENATLEKATDGNCTILLEKDESIETTTTLVQTLVTERFQFSESFCKHPENITCPKTLDPLCGSNDKFYLNICMFNKAKCENRSLQLQTLSICKDSSD